MDLQQQNGVLVIQNKDLTDKLTELIEEIKRQK